MARRNEEGRCWEAALCSAQDFDEDPLLPQKALPLPDDSATDAVVETEPADVLAAAASAMLACDALPDGAAESLMQPLAEAYLLAVRREAQLLPKVVSAASSSSRMRKHYMKAATTDASCALKMACPSSKKTYASAGETHSPNASDVESKGQAETNEYLLRAPPQNVALATAAKTGCPARHIVELDAISPYGQSSLGEWSREKLDCFTCSSSASSLKGEGPDNGKQNLDLPEGTFAGSLNDLHNLERKEIDTETKSEGAGVCDGGINSTARNKAKSTERGRQRRSSCTTAHSRREAAESIVGGVQRTDSAGGLSEKHEECLLFVDEGSGVDADTVVQREPAGGDSSGDTSSVGTVDGRVSGGITEKEAALSLNVSARTDHSSTVSPRHAKTKAEKISRNTRQKVAAYVDRLVLLDKQRAAASASASAPAAAWRAAALQKFKGLRNCVSCSEVLLEDHQAGVAIDCLSWSEQEWQLYCRCYPPSIGVLGRCDTVTLCRLLFLLVEDIKKQHRAIEKRDKNRSSSTNSGSCKCLVGRSQTLQGEGSIRADTEQNNLTFQMSAVQQRRTGEVEKVEESIFRNQFHPSEVGWIAQAGQDDGWKPSSDQPQQDSTTVSHLQGSAESDCVYSTLAEDEEGVSAGKEHHLFNDADYSSSRPPGIKEQAARGVAAETEISCVGSCRCCRHRGCCVTLQQACWLFGIFVFLDELQAMDADVASCIQQLRRLCEKAREQATGDCAAVEQRCRTSGHSTAEVTRKAPTGQEENVLLQESEKRTAMWVPTDLVAAINLLIVVINDFFNQR